MKIDQGLVAALLLGALVVPGCGGDTTTSADLAVTADLTSIAVPRTLDKSLPWYADNRARLDALIAAKGSAAPGYDPARKPVAVFDWDNTVVKNDAGDATLYYMLKNDKVLQPPAKNWRLTSPFLTADANTALKAACDALADAGQALPTSSNAKCATELLSLYDAGTTTTGKSAFAGWNYRRIEPAYAWAAQLLGGYTVEQARALITAARTANLNNPQGTTQTIGTYTPVNFWVRYYDQQKDLIGTLQANGFDVWVVSASPQAVIEEWAEGAGVTKDHVVGIRSVMRADVFTYNLQGCGDVPDGSNDGMGSFGGNSLITYIEGKRCWINKVIYGDSSAGAINRRDADKRQVFAAGDSDTDVEFLKDATVLKLVLNRNKKEIMCNAYGNAGGTWLINPMFIAPRAQMAGTYPCATSACKDAAGKSGPCSDENGKAIPDQMDTVFNP